MAKRKAKPATVFGRTKVAVPEGARVITPEQGEFWNPEAGDHVTGTLTGTRNIKNKKQEDVTRYLMLSVDGRMLILPNHFELHARIEEIEKKGNIMGVRVFVAFEGYEEADVQGGKMARYVVAVIENTGA